MKTMRVLAAASAATLLAAGASQASAATTFDVSVAGISFNEVDPGLVITASPFAIPIFQLNGVNDFAEFDVLKIGTGEGTVNTDFLSLFGEDTEHLPITVTFAFDDPSDATGSAVGGETYGFIAPFTDCGIIAGGCGAVEWGAPEVYTFGNGGSFQIELFGATFGTPGTANVRGRFTLLSESTGAVPEPATWGMMILGFGAMGGMMRASRRRKVTVAYA